MMRDVRFVDIRESCSHRREPRRQPVAGPDGHRSRPIWRTTMFRTTLMTPHARRCSGAVAAAAAAALVLAPGVAFAAGQPGRPGIRRAHRPGTSPATRPGHGRPQAARPHRRPQGLGIRAMPGRARRLRTRPGAGHRATRVRTRPGTPAPATRRAARPGRTARTPRCITPAPDRRGRIRGGGLVEQHEELRVPGCERDGHQAVDGRHGRGRDRDFDGPRVPGRRSRRLHADRHRGLLHRRRLVGADPAVRGPSDGDRPRWVRASTSRPRSTAAMASTRRVRPGR